MGKLVEIRTDKKKQQLFRGTIIVVNSDEKAEPIEIKKTPAQPNKFISEETRKELAKLQGWAINQNPERP